MLLFFNANLLISRSDQLSINRESEKGRSWCTN